MSRRALQRQIRQLRKQALVLQAQRHRLSLRQDLAALAAPFGQPGDGREINGTWRGIGLGIAGTVLSLLPGRWGRLLSIGMLSWRLLKRVLDARDEHTQAPPSK